MTQEETPRFASIWVQQGGPAVEARHNLDSDQHQQAVTDLFNSGFRPICVSGYTINNKPHFASIWEQQDGPAMVERHNETSEQFAQTASDLYPKGFAPVYVDIYTVDNERRYATIWMQADPEMRLEWRDNQDRTDYLYATNVFGDDGLRPVCVTSYATSEGVRHTGIWQLETNSAWYYALNRNHDEHQLVVDKCFSNGYRPVFVGGYTRNDEPRLHSIWLKEGGPPVQTRHGQSADQYQQTVNDLFSNGFRPICVTGY